MATGHESLTPSRGSFVLAPLGCVCLYGQHQWPHPVPAGLAALCASGQSAVQTRNDGLSDLALVPGQVMVRGTCETQIHTAKLLAGPWRLWTGECVGNLSSSA